MKKKLSIFVVFLLISILLASPVVQAATLLKVGSSGIEVKELQSNLQELGYDVGPIDGIFGLRTKNAVIKFQSATGLVADGLVGPLTQTAIYKSLELLRKPLAIVNAAKKYIGTPYLWGGSTPLGFDCSGYTQYVFKANGIELPRTSKEQFSIGTPVQFTNLKQGDLVFFNFVSGATVSHVGIYIGDNQFISATTSRGVVIYSFSPYWMNAYVGARSVL